MLHLISTTTNVLNAISRSLPRGCAVKLHAHFDLRMYVVLRSQPTRTLQLRARAWCALSSFPSEGAKFLRAQHLLRQDKVDEARSKREKREKEIAVAREANKKKKMELEKQIEEGRATRADLKRHLAAVKADNEKQKATEKLNRQDNKRRCQELAAKVCVKLAEYLTQDSDRTEQLKQRMDGFMVDGKRPKLKHAVFPEVLEFSPSNFRNYSVKLIGKKVDAAWASPAFAHHLFGPKGQDAALNPQPLIHLRKLISTLLPGYSKVFDTSLQVESIMAAQHRCLDMAFLEAVWRYSKLMGGKAFPPGTQVIALMEDGLHKEAPTSAGVTAVLTPAGSAASSSTQPMPPVASAASSSAVAPAATASGASAASSSAVAPAATAVPKPKPMGYTGPVEKKSKKHKKGKN